MSNDKFNFEQFTNVGRKLGNYNITISKNIAFGLNSGFYTAEKIENYTHAKIFYDKNTQAIGFLFTNNKDDKGTIKISHGKKNSGYVAAKTFFLSIFPGKLEEVNKYVGRYIPKTYNDEKWGKLYYIVLGEKENES
jgi:hypothetical protein